MMRDPKRPGLRERLRQILLSAGRTGMMTAEIVLQAGVSHGRANDVLNDMRKKGEVLKRADPAAHHGMKRWWHRDFANAAPPAPPPQPMRVAVPSRALRLDPSAPAIYPPGLKITHCPSQAPSRTHAPCADWIRDSSPWGRA